MIGNSIFVVSGTEGPHAIERLDLNGDDIINQEVIGNAPRSVIPILYPVSADFCV